MRRGKDYLGFMLQKIIGITIEVNGRLMHGGLENLLVGHGRTP
jgi:hypothetical protein